MNGSEDLDHAIEVFVRGFAFVRSRTHPYLAERVDGAWAMRDGARRDPAKNRREEWVAHGLPPEELHELAARHTRGKYALCVLRTPDEDPAPLREAYKALGYRLGAIEAFMLHRLAEVPEPGEDGRVERVTTAEQYDLLRAVDGPRPRPEALDPDGVLRQYLAVEGRTPVGWVASITVPEVARSTWCSEMFVTESHRRRGIGRELLLRMLHDDRDHGARWSVLSATHTGALLYPTVGYEPLGELLVYTPSRALTEGRPRPTAPPSSRAPHGSAP